ncbi:hypothetical protein LCGC14_1939480 [marine sediment metagenome]|uniref:Uncharacterized protein n=1 Tax=marine sediment metagenome TaxID=412755 RepID=A0A0F9II41_9ZZZZ
MAFNAPLNQEFFDDVSEYNPSEDPSSGEAWLFLPLYDPIDLTIINNVTITFEMFIKDLFEVYQWEEVKYFVLSKEREYVDSLDRTYYAPLPLRVSYFANPEGLTVSAF